MAADYVIVGAGSAGCVLAARLSEDPDVKVLLLEAGGPDTVPELQIPAAFPAVFKSSLDWDLLGEQEPGLGNRRLYLPRGRVIGGSGSINAMIYLRGHRADYDEWAEMGCDGWSYDDVLPYFKRAEDNERGADAYHGAGGPLAVADSRSMHPLVDTMLEAAVQAGHELIPDLNVDRPEGVGRFQLTQRDGRRCSTADAYLHPAEERPNLEVQTGVFVQRIAFEGDRAVGVEVVRNGSQETMRAEREVILSAGSYQSPVLLMLSGIGLEEELAPLGITVRESLPVGRNMQDHCMAQLNYLTDEPTLFGIFNPENFALLEGGRGPLTSNIPEAGGFLRTRPDLSAPDIEFHFAPSLFFDEGLTAPGDGRLLLRPGRDQALEPRPGDAARGRWPTRSRACSATSSLPRKTVRASSTGCGWPWRSRSSPHSRPSSGSPSASPPPTPTTTSSSSSAARDSPSTTRPRRVRWGPSSTRSSASTGRARYESSTRRSCRRSPAPTRTRRR